VQALLDVTPASRTGRLLGKYLGACAATAAPCLAVSVLFGVTFAVWRHRPVALVWALATFTAVLLPLLLLTGALAFLGPQLVPAPLFRVLLVAVWFWAGATEVESQFPSLAGTVFSLTMDYPLAVFFGATSATAGPHPGAALNGLRPAPTAATGLLALALMLGITATIVAAARALHARRTD
jgi:hypothetical protein